MNPAQPLRAVQAPATADDRCGVLPSNSEIRCAVFTERTPTDRVCVFVPREGSKKRAGKERMTDTEEKPAITELRNNWGPPAGTSFHCTGVTVPFQTQPMTGKRTTAENKLFLWGIMSWESLKVHTNLRDLP